MQVSLEGLFALTPKALPWAHEALADLNTVLALQQLHTPRRAAHFLAQVLHETDGLSVFVENLNYSAEGLHRTWPSRFKTVDAAERYAHNPRLIANTVYGGRMGNVNPDDGWTFRGRGLLQITGRTNYTKVGEVCGLDLAGTPDLVLDPLYALRVACGVWHRLECDIPADGDNLVAVTKRINGGLTGMASRMAWLVKARTVVS